MATETPPPSKTQARRPSAEEFAAEQESADFGELRRSYRSFTSMFPDADFHWFPLENPGIVSIPVGFLPGVLGTYLSEEEPDTGKYAEPDVRSLTGTGAH